MPYRCAEDLVGKFVQSNGVVGLGTGVLVSQCSCVPDTVSTVHGNVYNECFLLVEHVMQSGLDSEANVGVAR